MKASSLQRERLGLWGVLAVLAGLGLSSCQPLALHVTEVSATGELLKVSAQNCDYGGEIYSIEALDEHTVQFTLCEPDPAFLSKVASPVFSIQDRAVLDAAHGRSDLLGLTPNASGPYQVAAVGADQITLKPNPFYWGTPVRIQSLTFRWSDADLTRIGALNRGEIQALDRLDTSFLIRYRSDENYQIIYRPALNVGYLGMNNQTAPFTDERVRQGISQLIDRQKLLSGAYPAGSALADQFLPASIDPGHTLALPWLDYDVTAGLELLKQAGFDFSQELVLTYNLESSDYFPTPRLVAENISSQLNLAGLNVTVVALPAEEFEAGLVSGAFSLFLDGWTADYPDANSFYQSEFVAGAAQFGEPYIEIQNQANTAAHTADISTRKQAYDALNNLVRTQVPAIPLAYGSSVLIFENQIGAVQIGPLSENFERMVSPSEQLVFMQTNAPQSLWPGDEDELDTLRIARLLYSTLVTYAEGTTDIQAALAESWESNADFTQVTFHLRSGVTFQNGELLDANDVVATFSALWNAADPNHQGRSGEFRLFKAFFQEFLNNPQ